MRTVHSAVKAPLPSVPLSALLIVSAPARPPCRACACCVSSSSLSAAAKVCPYFLARELQERAHLVLMPYNYAVDATMRRATGLELRGSAVILDEVLLFLPFPPSPWPPSLPLRRLCTKWSGHTNKQGQRDLHCARFASRSVSLRGVVEREQV